MTAQACGCCRDELHPSKIAFIDGDFGQICFDCFEGIRNGKEVMEDANIAGVYRGPCGDNERRLK